MTNDAHSGSRWEPEQRREATAELPAAAQPPTAEQAVPPVPQQMPKKRRPRAAALTAAGLVLVGSAGGFAIGSAAASPDAPTVEQTGTDGVPVPPGGGQLPDSDGDGRPDFGGRGSMPDVDGDDGFVPPDGATDDGAVGAVDPA